LKVPDKNAEDRIARDHNVQSLIEELDVILGQFVIPSKDEDRRANLVQISKRGERLGLKILSQPAVWEFLWNIERRPTTMDDSGKVRGPRKPLVVFPAFQRVTDNKSVRIDPPEVLRPPQYLQQSG
jgi:hypothetical protein